jgi:hypothetical protein
MLISSSTDVYTTLGVTATGILKDFGGYIVIIAGLVLGFYIIERIVFGVFPPKFYGDNKENDI